jgi:hypothetical protein
MKAKIIEANEVGSLDKDQILAVNSAIESMNRSLSKENYIKKIIKELGFFYIHDKGILIIVIRKTELQL